MGGCVRVVRGGGWECVCVRGCMVCGWAWTCLWVGWSGTDSRGRCSTSVGSPCPLVRSPASSLRLRQAARSWTPSCPRSASAWTCGPPRCCTTSSRGRLRSSSESARSCGSLRLRSSAASSSSFCPVRRSARALRCPPTSPGTHSSTHTPTHPSSQPASQLPVDSLRPAPSPAARIAPSLLARAQRTTTDVSLSFGFFCKVPSAEQQRRRRCFRQGGGVVWQQSQRRRRQVLRSELLPVGVRAEHQQHGHGGSRQRQWW